MSKEQMGLFLNLSPKEYQSLESFPYQFPLNKFSKIIKILNKKERQELVNAFIFPPYKSRQNQEDPVHTIESNLN